MIKIVRVLSSRTDKRIIIPASFCHELDIKRNDQFYIFAIDEKTLILRKTKGENIFEDNQLLEKIKSINYGK